jgi:hypothetical protein
MVAGFAGNVVPKGLSLLGLFELPAWGDPILIGAALAGIVTVAVSRLTTVTEAERRYRERLLETPPGELDEEEHRRSLRWPVVLIVGGILLMGLMVAGYALPYQSATGEAAGLRGEMVLSIACGLVLVGCGVLARWGILRRL